MEDTAYRTASDHVAGLVAEGLGLRFIEGWIESLPFPDEDKAALWLVAFTEIAANFDHHLPRPARPKFRDAARVRRARYEARQAAVWERAREYIRDHRPHAPSGD